MVDSRYCKCPKEREKVVRRKWCAMGIVDREVSL